MIQYFVALAVRVLQFSVSVSFFLNCMLLLFTSTLFMCSLTLGFER